MAGLIIIAIIVAMVVFVVVLQDAERRIPVQYSKKLQGRKQVGGQSTHIPLKVNTGGGIPVLRQSLLQTPVIIAAILGKGNGTGIGSKILKGMSQSNWCNPEEPIYSIGLVVYILLIIAFAYFYTQITFNPLEIANNMKKAGGFIPGIRPGKPTSDYLNQILTTLYSSEQLVCPSLHLFQFSSTVYLRQMFLSVVHQSSLLSVLLLRQLSRLSHR